MKQGPLGGWTNNARRYHNSILESAEVQLHTRTYIYIKIYLWLYRDYLLPRVSVFFYNLATKLSLEPDLQVTYQQDWT